MGYTDRRVHIWLNEIKATPYISLHFDSPVHAGAYASEVSGEGYVRQKATYGNPSGRTMWNTNQMRFQGLGATVVTHIGGWDLQSKGNLEWEYELAEPARILQGGGYTILVGEIAHSFA